MRNTVVLVALMMAGCAAERPDPSADDSTDANAATPAVEPLTFAFDGYLSFGVCPPSGPGVCSTPVGVPQVPVLPSEDASYQMAVGPGIYSGLATLTWKTHTPTTPELSLAVQPYSSCGGNCRMYEPGPVVRGTSPLTLSFEGLEAGADAIGLAWSVSHPLTEAGPFIADAHADQTFTLEGEVHTA